MKFSTEQQAAIDAGNRELLVSAAAGSGKTAVLIEKIYTMLKDGGMSVDRMLVVTFTRAAAAEMRERLKQRMAGEAEPRLRRERERLELAHISTLHSFCHALVQEYFQAVDVDPLSAVADATMASNLYQEALDEAMEALYAQAAEGDDAAAALTAKFEDKQIVSMAAELYTFLMTLADPFDWLKAQAEKRYTLADLETGAMADTLMQDCRVLLDGARELADSLAALAKHPDCHPGYLPCIQSDREAVAALIRKADEGLTAAVQAAQLFALDKMPGIRGLDDEQKEVNLQYKDIREGLKKLAGRVGGLYAQPPEQSIARLNRMQPALLGLHGVCAALHAGYMARKKKRSLLDPSDLEHMALEILKHPEIRAAVSHRFDAVFVDEYQDISGVQEAVLNFVKRADEPGNVSRETSGDPPPLPQRFFYVGDVKQSIYRFRQADPTLFMQKERTFADDAAAPQRRIDLNRNYRSRGAVLAAVNRVFETVMRADVTEIAYDARARLYPGQETEGDTPVELHLFTQKLSAADKTRAQAAAVAGEILRRVGQPYFDRKENRMRTLRYRDIAILAPRMKGVDETLIRTLGARHIPAYAEGSGLGLQSDEIAQVLCHLRLMDNIQDDLSLLACLRSPAIGFTDAELAEIRIITPHGSYLSAVRQAAQGGGALADRCSAALDTLSHERFLLRSMPLAQYLWSFLSRSGLYAFYGCQPYGKLRQANLRLLCEKAAEAQARGGGLRAFLQSVVSVSAARESVSPTILSPKEDVIRIMSVHKSKGLEFPVVFLLGLDTGFDAGRSSELKLHSRLGVALPYVDEVLRVKGDTLLSAAVDMRLKNENLAERARVLYVGMTRARDELLLLGCAETPAFSPARPSAYAVSTAKNMLDWLIASVDPDADAFLPAEALSDPQSTSFPHKTGVFRIVSHNSVEETEALLRLAQVRADRESLEKQRSRLEALLDEARKTPPGPGALARIIAPDIPVERRPFKVGVTALVRARMQHRPEAPELTDPDTADPADRETVSLKRLPLPLTRPRQMADLPRLPAFMRAQAGEQTGLLRGVAAHKALCLLQYAPLRAAQGEAALCNAIEAQLDALANSKVMTAQERKLTDAAALAAFFASPWGQAALAADTLHREWSFVLALPEEDGMLVQGVIDLCYIRDGQWELLDYKTDAVSDPEALWPLYEGQIALYRRALEEVTGIPVRSVTLYALALGQGTTRLQG